MTSYLPRRDPAPVDRVVSENDMTPGNERRCTGVNAFVAYALHQQDRGQFPDGLLPLVAQHPDAAW